MIAIAGVELETLVSEPDALTTRPPCFYYNFATITKQQRCTVTLLSIISACIGNA